MKSKYKNEFPQNNNIVSAEVNGLKEHDTSIIDLHVISNEALDQIDSELLKGNQWVANNTASYFLDKHDIYFFTSKDEANDFAESNISEVDSYRIINGSQLSKMLTEKFTIKTNSII